MAVPFAPLSMPHPVVEYTGEGSALATAPIADAAGQASAVTTGETAEFSSAHQAVEAVLHTIEQLATREQKSVNLKFSVGDTDLSVRVELRADEVRATFSTDSSELRAALSQEWQALTGNGAERPGRFAPAVFTGSDQSALNASTGDASSRHREQSARRNVDADTQAAGRVRGAASHSTPHVAVASGPRVSIAPATARRLHTLA